MNGQDWAATIVTAIIWLTACIWIGIDLGCWLRRKRKERQRMEAGPTRLNEIHGELRADPECSKHTLGSIEEPIFQEFPPMPSRVNSDDPKEAKHAKNKLVTMAVFNDLIQEGLLTGLSAITPAGIAAADQYIAEGTKPSEAEIRKSLIEYSRHYDVELPVQDVTWLIVDRLERIEEARKVDW